MTVLFGVVSLEEETVVSHDYIMPMSGFYSLSLAHFSMHNFHMEVIIVSCIGSCALVW